MGTFFGLFRITIPLSPASTVNAGPDSGDELEHSEVETDISLEQLVDILETFSLCACSQQDLEDIAYGEGDGYATIVWGDKTYVPYGALSAYGERGKQIGIVNGDKDDRVYELKGYSVDEWIVNSFPYDGGGMLLREVNVKDIPDGWRSDYEWNK